MAHGLEESKTYIGESIDLQNQLVAQVTKKEVEWPIAVDYTPEVYDRVKAIAEPKLQDVVVIAEKQERNAAQDAALEATMAELGLDEDDVRRS